MSLVKFKQEDHGKSIGRSGSIAEVCEAYNEMFSLLEDYAPAWYTKELHEKARAGLEMLRRLSQTDAGANLGRTQ